MKRYIAFHAGYNSGIATKEKAYEWAANFLGQGKVSSVHIAEVIEVVERATPAINTKSFLCELEEPPAVRKSA